MDSTELAGTIIAAASTLGAGIGVGLRALARARREQTKVLRELLEAVHANSKEAATAIANLREVVVYLRGRVEAAMELSETTDRTIPPVRSMTPAEVEAVIRRRKNE